jgi:hypothetical protein
MLILTVSSLFWTRRSEAASNRFPHVPRNKRLQRTGNQLASHRQLAHDGSCLPAAEAQRYAADRWTGLGQLYLRTTRNL